MKLKESELKSQPFELLYPQDRIEKQIRGLGGRLARDYAGKNPVFLGVLKGCFIFLADLVRAVNIPMEVEFISAHSYGDDMQPGKLTLSGGPDVSLRGRHVLLVEAVVDTGRTAKRILELLKTLEPASVEIVTLLNKTGRREDHELQVKYAGIEVNNDFVIGYGLDHGQFYRNLPFIGKVIDKTAVKQEINEK